MEDKILQAEESAKGAVTVLQNSRKPSWSPISVDGEQERFIQAWVETFPDSNSSVETIKDLSNVQVLRILSPEKQNSIVTEMYKKWNSKAANRFPAVF